MTYADRSFISGVSRSIRVRTGYRAQPNRLREGIRISNGGRPRTASVTVDVDTPTVRQVMTNDIREALIAAGYTITRDDNDGFFYVTRPIEPTPEA